MSEGKICTPVSAVPIPRFRRRRGRNGLPFLLLLSRGAVSEVAAESFYCKFCRERGRPQSARCAAFLVLFAALQKEPAPEGGIIPLSKEGEIPLRGAGYFGYGQSSQTHCGPPTCGWQRSRRKKIGCFATGLRYGAIGRGICLKSGAFQTPPSA